MARKADAWKQPDVPKSTEEVNDVEEADEDTDHKRCFICFELESTARKKIFFVPCTHSACEPCVQFLRREAVCKAVKGVMCPYCRQAIESYSNVKPSRQVVKIRPGDVKMPGHLKGTRFVLKAEKGCPKGKPRVPAPYGWQGITSIGGLNDYSPPPNVTGADGPGLKPNRSEENLLDNFQGMAIKSSDNLLAMAETVSGSKQLHYNLKHLSGKKQKALLKQLLESLVPHAKRLATHHCGNYTMQRMLAFASQHRTEQVNGECGFTALVRSVCKDKSVPEVSCHEKGTFVVQKMVHCMLGLAELKLVMDSIEGKVAVMANSSNACFSLERIVEICIVCVSRPGERQPCAPAPDAARFLCNIALELCSTKELVFKASQASNYATPSLLVECLRWSATETPTRALLLSLARKAEDFSAMGKWGKRFLQGLLSLDIPEVAEAIVESLIGQPERPAVGCFANLVVDSKDLFYSLLAAPCLSDDHRDKLVCDFMLKAQEDPYFLKHPHALQGFCFALCLLPPNLIKDHLEILRALGTCSPSLVQTIHGMQAEYCLPYHESPSQNGSSGPLTASAQAPNAPRLSQTSPGPPPSRESTNTENFPPLGPPQKASARSQTGGSAPNSPGTSVGSRISSVENPSEQTGNSRATSQVAGKKSSKAKGSSRDSATVPEEEEASQGAGARRKLKMGMTGGGSGSINVNQGDVPEGSLGEGAGASRQSVGENDSVSSSAASTMSVVESAPSSTSMENGLAGPPDVHLNFPNQGSQRVPLPFMCAQCQSEPACMVFLHCRHLSSCKTCSRGLGFCPLCNSSVVQVIEVAMAVNADVFSTSASPPGSFSSFGAPLQATIPDSSVQNSSVPAPPSSHLQSWGPTSTPHEAPTYIGGTSPSTVSHFPANSFSQPPDSPSTSSHFFSSMVPPGPGVFGSNLMVPSTDTGSFGASLPLFPPSSGAATSFSGNGNVAAHQQLQSHHPSIPPGFEGVRPLEQRLPFGAFQPSANSLAPSSHSVLGPDSFKDVAYNMQHNLGLFPQPAFMPASQGSFLVSGNGSASASGMSTQQFTGNSFPPPNPHSPGDSFPEVNLSFLTTQSGSDTMPNAIQLPADLSFNHQEVPHLQHDAVSDDFNKLSMRSKHVIRPAPYLPPGLY